MEQLIIEFVTNNPQLASVLMVWGIARAIFKPLVSLFEAYFMATENKEDDKKWAEFKSGKIYWFLDYFFSIKIPEKQVPVEGQNH